MKNILYKKYTQTHDQGDYVNFKNKRVTVKNEIKRAKNQFYNKIFTNNNKKGAEGSENIFESRKMWKQLKEITNSNKILTLSSIVHNGERINKPLDIANIANNYYIQKVKNIRENFKDKLDPLFYMEKLFQRNKKEFKIPLLTIKDTEELIKKAKNLWTLCDHDISMNVIKMLNKK